MAERRVRLGLVLAEVGRANKLQVTAEELRRAMLAEARRFPGQERKIIEFFEKNPQAGESLAGPILEDKVVDFILERAAVSNRTVTFDELRRVLDDDGTSEPGSDQIAADVSGTGPDSESAADVASGDDAARVAEAASGAPPPDRENG